MTAVGFEPTPLRTGAWSQRIRPLGQTVDAQHVQTFAISKSRLAGTAIAKMALRWSVNRMTRPSEKNCLQKLMQIGRRTS